jgi:hypothetical protein
MFFMGSDYLLQVQSDAAPTAPPPTAPAIKPSLIGRATGEIAPGKSALTLSITKRKTFELSDSR